MKRRGEWIFLGITYGVGASFAAIGVAGVFRHDPTLGAVGAYGFVGWLAACLLIGSIGMLLEAVQDRREKRRKSEGIADEILHL